MIQSKIDKLFSFTDDYGNVFICKDGKLTLKRPSQISVHHIGKIVVIKNLLIYKKSEKEKDIYHIHNGWTIPTSIYENIDGIWFTSETTSYKILKKEADKHLEQMRTKKDSKFEPKVCVPIRFWSQNPLNL